MFPCKRKPLLTLALLALCAGMVSPLHGQEEPYEGLWERTPQGHADDLFLYRMVLRYQARGGLRAAGLLPDQFRAPEDSLAMRSDRFEEFIYLQDSLGLGWLPPAWAKASSTRDLTKREVFVQIDSSYVDESISFNGTPVHPSVRLPLARYLEEMTHRSFRKLWASQAVAGLQAMEAPAARKGLMPELALPWEMPGAVRSVVGAGKPNLRVGGSERISFSGTSRWFPDRPVTEFQRQQSKFPQLDMKQELNLQLTGNIGDKVSVDVDQSSEAATPLSNRIKIHYKGYEDEIIQRVDLGNTSLSLPGTQYVSYGGRQEGLFGINAQALLGSVEVTGILSKQEGKNDTRSVSSGSEVRTFTINDWEYKKGKFFFLIDPEGQRLLEGDQVTDIQVWVDDRNGNNNSEQLTVPGYATLSGSTDPDSLTSARRATGDWNQLVPNQDFSVQLDVYPGYPVLILDDSQVLDGRMTKALGVLFQTTSGLSVGGSRGSDPDSLVLKLLRPAAEMGGTNPINLTAGIFAETRRLELRNVYDLGSNLSTDGLSVRIRRKQTQGGITNPDRIGNSTFLELTGLDLYTDAGESQTLGPDGKIDRGRINYESGYVMFCDLQPFSPLPSDADRCPDGRPDRLSGDYLAPRLYTRNDWTSVADVDTLSKYLFEVTARTAVSKIALNAFNIIQGSEVVTAGGRALTRDRDYSIDYDTGEIEILDAADVRDTDEIKVSYSYLPFGGGGQKTLLGGALRYRPQSTKFDFSTTWIYESKGAPGLEGRRPRLGQEPTRTVVGELATSYKTDSWMLTNLVDAIPGIRTTAKSNFSVDTGVGLSFPNPNTRDQLYVDDFEGAKDVFSISMNRLSWKPSGIPAGATSDYVSQNPERRGECWFYTPRAAVKEGDLQPTRESGGGLADQEKDNNRQILEMHFFPAGSSEAEKKESWFSLVQPLSQRGTDLSRAQFLDLWVNDFRSVSDTSLVQRREGKLHVEIGVVSEDAIWQRVEPNGDGGLERGAFASPNRQLDTEDKINQDGQLDDPGGGTGEDRGVDFLTDAEEGSGSDPAYDNWDFEEKEDDNNRDLIQNPNQPDPGRPTLSETRFAKFAKIDGTQGNGRLDSEDLNGNANIDQSEGYFSFTVDLSNESSVEFESSQALDQDPKYAPYARGWRRIRIPLTAQFYQTVGTPGWDQVRHLRLWLDGFSRETVLQLGGIEVTGNRWLKGVIRDAQGVEVPESELQARGEDFFPAVLNNKDNSTSEYTPPFKPREQQNVEEREQTLTLELRNFPPGHRASAYRTFSQAQDFVSLYRTIEFYLNRRIREGPPDPNLEFYVRFARNTSSEEDNYYEYRTAVPHDWVLQPIDIGELSRLQLARADSVSGATVQRLESGAVITRKGNPSFTAIQRISFGIVNVGATTVVNGSVWIDELRLTSVKRDTGIANRVSLGVGLADLGSFNLGYQRVDANFLRIGSERGEGTTKTDLNLSTRVNADKFLERWGVRLPVTVTVGRGKQVPKFRTNGDLVLDKPRPSDITESANNDLSFNYSRNRSADPWLKYTIDAVSVSGRTSKTATTTPDIRDTTYSSTGSLQYSLPLQGGPPLRIYRETRLRLLPTSFSMSLSGGRQTSIEYRRKNADLLQEAFEESRRLKTKTASMSWTTGARPIDQVSYTFDQTRDLLLSTAPTKLLGVNIGTETSRRHQLTASEQFPLFKKTIVPKVSWTGNSENAFNRIQTSGGSSQRSNSYDNGSSWTVSGSLPIDAILRKVTAIRIRGGGEPPAAQPGDSTGTSAVVRPAPRVVPRGGAGSWLVITPISASSSFSRSKKLDRFGGEPSLLFQLGLSPDPGSGVHGASGFSEGSGRRRDVNISTDVTFLYDVKIRTAYLDSYNKNTLNRASSTTKIRKFPDLDVNWGKIHRRIRLDRITKDLRASTRYTRETRESGTSTNPLDRRETTITMRPFLNLDATLNNGVSAKLTSAYTSTNSSQFGLLKNVSLAKTRQIGLSLRKTLNLTRMVLNPLTKKRTKVSSKLDVSLAVDLSDSRRESGPVGKPVLLEDRAKLSLSTTAGYSFTSTISGNAGLSFGQDTDRKNRTNTARFVSVTVSAAFNF